MYGKKSLICMALTAIVVAIPTQLAAASSNEGGYELRVRITEWPFGSDSVRVNIETANGYTDSGRANTATSGTPTVTFDIPPNQGSSVFVCADPEGILAIGNCDTYNTGGQDTTVSISAY